MATKTKTTSGWTRIFKRSFKSKEKDEGTKDDIQAGDVITFLFEGRFTTRRATAVRGLLIEMAPQKDLEDKPREKPHLVSKNEVTEVIRPPKSSKKTRRTKRVEKTEEVEDDFDQLDLATGRFYAA